MRPKELQNIIIRPTQINEYIIDRLDIDLLHINFGLNKTKKYKSKKRSNFIPQDIANAFITLDGLEIQSEEREKYKYFFVEKDFFNNKKLYRMIFCIDETESNTCGIITFFKVCKEYYDPS